MTKIELRNVKHAAFASEETPCFEATVYIDGQKVGTVANDGNGGSCLYHPFAIHERIEAYAKTLPAEVTEYDDPQNPGHKMIFQPDADSVVMELLDNFLQARDLKRLLGNRILFLRDGKVYQTKAVKKPDLARSLEKPLDVLLGHFKAESILNLLPFEQALALYTRKAAP